MRSNMGVSRCIQRAYGAVWQHLAPFDSRDLMFEWKRRVSEILPDDEFEVALQGTALRIRGIGARLGAGRVSAADPVLRLPLPASQRLKLFFADECRGLEEFVTSVRGEAWPGPGADLHVNVDSQSVRIWWGGDEEKEAVLRVVPLARKDIAV